MAWIIQLWNAASRNRSSYLHRLEASESDWFAMEGRSCETPGCDQPAKLQCPTCIKLGIQVLRSLAIMGPICASADREKERESGKVMERKQGLQEILNSECREAFSVISSASRLTGTYTRSFSCLIGNLSLIESEFCNPPNHSWTSGAAQVGKGKHCLTVFQERRGLDKPLAWVQLYWKASSGSSGLESEQNKGDKFFSCCRAPLGLFPTTYLDLIMQTIQRATLCRRWSSRETPTSGMILLQWYVYEMSKSFQILRWRWARGAKSCMPSRQRGGSSADLSEQPYTLLD